jgi:glycolate oxidase iron-sulfur subunit
MPIKALEEVLLRCMKCGECQAVCPTFTATGRETEVARGRVRLVKALFEGELKPNRNLAEKLYSCLLCRACSARCPSGVEADKLLVAAREELASKLGMPLKEKVFLSMLEHPRLLSLTCACARNLRLIPSYAASKRTFLSADSMSREVVFYAGCMIGHAYPEIEAAVRKVLEGVGVRVKKIRERCCGLPAYSAGSMGRARKLAEYNLSKLEGSEAVVTACPTCALAFKEYPRFLNGELRERALKLSRRIYDLSEFLIAMDGLENRLCAVRERVAFHDACHAFYGLGLAKEPRRLVRLIPGLELVEIEQGCCGFAGLFSFEYPLLAQRINNRRINEIAATKAEMVVTSCPGCKYYLQKGLRRRGEATRVLHIAELLSKAI